MDRLAYFRARQKGDDPADAADEAGGRDWSDVDAAAADDFGDSSDSNAGEPTGPVFGPPTPPTFNDSEDSKAMAPSDVQTSAPPPAPKPDFTAQLSSALARARQRRVMPDDIGDDALASSMQADEDRGNKDRFTEALRAAFTRSAPNYASARSGPSAATQALLQKRQTFQQGASADQAEALREAQLLSKSGGKSSPGGLSEYQKYEMDRNARLDAEKKTATEQKAADAKSQLERDRATLQKDFPGYDLSQADEKTIEKLLSLRHAKATESVAQSNLAIASAQEGRKKSDYAALGQGIPFGGGTLKYTGTGTPRADDVDKVQGIASGFGAALSGMDDLEKSLQAFAAHPGVDSKRDVESKVRVVSAALNSAIGSGAMSEAEAHAMANALGADILSPAGVQAVVTSLLGDDPKAAQVLTTRLHSARSAAKATALGKLRAYRYDFEGGADASPQSAAEQRPEGLPETARQVKGAWYVPTPDGWVRWKAGK